ncbi:MAG: glycosyltransferase [Chitinivibrionales bacterium]|nr:glycosyltransferase [Chitinivibrionales bacterium]
MRIDFEKCDLLNQNQQKQPDQLVALRNAVNGHTMSKEQFLLQAAAIYLNLKKPLRSQALLSLIDYRNLNYEQLFLFQSLHERLQTEIKPECCDCTLTMIVKNEQQCLGTALQSVDTLVDEMVICDTGSTDGTQWIAQQFGIKLIEDPWIDDFSHARNKALDASSGKWILWLDADDCVDPSSLEALDRLIKEVPNHAALLRIINERDCATPLEFMQVRLFPRMNGIRFEQRVHEQIMESIARKKIPFSKHPTICIHHYGYHCEQLVRQKAQRNKSLIIAELSLKPTETSLQLNLGDTLFILEDFEGAKQAYQKVISTLGSWKKNSDIYVQAHLNLAQLFLKEKNFLEAKRFLLRALYLDNTRIEAFFGLGRLSHNENEIAKAIEYYLKSATINPPIRMTASDNLRIRLESIYYIVDILKNNHHYLQAQQILHSAMELYPKVAEYYTQMGQVMLDQKKTVEALDYFTSSLHLCPQNNNAAIEGIASVNAVLAHTHASND